MIIFSEFFSFLLLQGSGCLGFFFLEVPIEVLFFESSCSDKLLQPVCKVLRDYVVVLKGVPNSGLEKSICKVGFKGICSSFEGCSESK